MAIIDRVKKRTETDLDDVELQLVIDEVNQDVINRYGPHSDPANPVSEMYYGYKKRIVVDRPIDTSQPIVVVEWYDSTEVSAVTMNANDYRMINTMTLERRADGPNGSWLWNNRVKVTYTPVNDGDQREEVIIKLVILSIQYEAVKSKMIGGPHGVNETNLDYQLERDTLMASLAPRSGLYVQ